MARGDDRSGDFEVVEQVGAELATVVLQTLDALQDQPGTIGSSGQRASSSIDVSGRFDQQKTSPWV